MNTSLSPLIHRILVKTNITCIQVFPSALYISAPGSHAQHAAFHRSADQEWSDQTGSVLSWLITAFELNYSGLLQTRQLPVGRGNAGMLVPGTEPN